MCKYFESEDILNLQRDRKSLYSEVICSLHHMVIELDIQMQKMKKENLHTDFPFQKKIKQNGT